MVGVVRLYLHPREGLPKTHEPKSYPPVIDCLPEQANSTRRKWQRQGFRVLAFSI